MAARLTLGLPLPTSPMSILVVEVMAVERPPSGRGCWPAMKFLVVRSIEGRFPSLNEDGVPAFAGTGGFNESLALAGVFRAFVLEVVLDARVWLFNSLRFTYS